MCNFAYRAESMPSTASFPSSHPLFAGTIERLAPSARAVLDKHDLIVSIGGDLFTQSMATGMEPVPAHIPIVGDAKNILPRLTAEYRALEADPAAPKP